MLTLTFCAAVLFLLAVGGAVLLLTGLSLAALFCALLPFGLLAVGTVLLVRVLMRPAWQREELLPGGLVMAAAVLLLLR